VLGNHGLWLALAVFLALRGCRWRLSGGATGGAAPGFRNAFGDMMVKDSE
jgi:glycine/D-amino acid oxidase-like deaminating enzyme